MSPLRSKDWNACRISVSKIWEVIQAVIQNSERKGTQKILEFQRNSQVGDQGRRGVEADGTLKLR
jgi:hypothetical protein